MKNLFFVFLVGFSVSLIVAPIFIKLIKQLKGGQNILEYVDAHKVKQGTPTMGGIIFLVGLLVGFFAIFDDNSRLISIIILVTFAYAILGFLDDFLKIKFKHNEGLKAYQKAIGQLGIACIVAFFVYYSGLVGNSVILPFGLKEIEIGAWIIPFIIFFYLAVTNGVNLTDGLDGLAGGTSSIFLVGFVIVFSNVIKEVNLSDLLIAEYYNLLLLVMIMIGSLVSFLIFNWHPASIFMGDTGSLAIGGFIATTLILTRMYLLMLVVGVMFVVNTASVVIQVVYYKFTKKRVFKMAPLHHHYEKKGYKETKIVYTYISISLVGIAIAMLIFV